MICIDPGLRGCGVAFFLEDKLRWAFYVHNPVEHGRGYAAHRALASAVRGAVAAIPNAYHLGAWLIEHPVVYPGMPKTDPNDLLDVVAVGAAVAALAPGAVITVIPSEWKGQVKKSTMLGRITGKLKPEELDAIQKANKSDMEDVVDAIGIGLWKLNRLNVKTYPGATP